MEFNWACFVQGWFISNQDYFKAGVVLLVTRDVRRAKKVLYKWSHCWECVPFLRCAPDDVKCIIKQTAVIRYYCPYFHNVYDPASKTRLKNLWCEQQEIPFSKAPQWLLEKKPFQSLWRRPFELDALTSNISSQSNFFFSPHSLSLKFSAVSQWVLAYNGVSFRGKVSLLWHTVCTPKFLQKRAVAAVHFAV